jgi:hypothetical protein
MDEGSVVKMEAPAEIAAETPAFARGLTGPLGKYTESVKTHLDEDTYVDLLKLCHSKNTTPAELIRAAVFLVLYDQTPEQMVAARQTELLAPLAERMGELRG